MTGEPRRLRRLRRLRQAPWQWMPSGGTTGRSCPLAMAHSALGSFSPRLAKALFERFIYHTTSKIHQRLIDHTTSKKKKRRTPVQMALYLCEPMKKDRVSTNGLAEARRFQLGSAGVSSKSELVVLPRCFMSIDPSNFHGITDKDGNSAYAGNTWFLMQ